MSDMLFYLNMSQSEEPNYQIAGVIISERLAIQYYTLNHQKKRGRGVFRVMSAAVL